MTQVNSNNQSQKREARASKSKLAAIKKVEPKPQPAQARPRPIFNADLDGEDTLLVDSWGCNPELSLTGSHSIDLTQEMQKDKVQPPQARQVTPEKPGAQATTPNSGAKAPLVNQSAPPPGSSASAKAPLVKQSAPPVASSQVAQAPLLRQNVQVPTTTPAPKAPTREPSAQPVAAKAAAQPVVAKPEAEKPVQPTVQETILESAQVSNESPESLAELSEAALNVIAGNPRTQSSTLCWLAAHYNPEIRATVARNSNALPETVWLLAKDHDQAVRLAIAEHLESNRDVLRALVDDPSPLVSWRAQNTLSMVAELPGSQETSASCETRSRRQPKKSQAAKQQNRQGDQSPEEIEFLVLVAQKPTTPGRRLAQLAEHGNAQVRAAVAENANCPLEALWSLAKDSVAEVKVKLADNYNCPVEIIESLQEDADQYVVWRARTVLAKLNGQIGPELALEEEPSRVSPRLAHSR